jgi:hypothetical protein
MESQKKRKNPALSYLNFEPENCNLLHFQTGRVLGVAGGDHICNTVTNSYC